MPKVKISRTPTYRSWASAKYRCLNPRDSAFHRYGGRGITICDRWRQSFENFLADMGEKPTGLTLDRINNDGNYEPGNCRWATYVMQNRNRRGTHPLTFAGITAPISEWAEITGIHRMLIGQRVWNGWSVMRALTTPPRTYERRAA